jgi:pyochelin biosynthesis protein PchC
MQTIDDWIRIYQPAAADAPCLVCLPHAGGAATAFVGLAKRLAPQFEVLAVQYPGRQDRRHEPCITDICALADAIQVALMPFAGRQLALFGHSMGALVGYELAQRLERDDDKRLLGFLASGRRAPSSSRLEMAPTTDEEILADLQHLSGTDVRVLRDEGMLEIILPPLRADYGAVERYQPDPGDSIHCPTIVCVGDSDPLTTIAEAEGWRHHVDAPFQLRVFAGGHFYLNECEDDLAQLLAQQLADWGAAAPRS